MKKISILVVAPALVVSAAAWATPLLTVNAAGDPTGVTGLVVDTTTYNVTFSIESYNAQFPSSSPPTFEGNSTGADDASKALASVLLSADVTSLDSPTGDCTTFAAYCTIITPYGLQSVSNPGSSTPIEYPLGYAAVRQNAPNGTFNWTGGIFYEDFDANFPLGSTDPGVNRYYEYAVYSVAGASSGTVPEPATLSLLGLGLAGLGLARGNRKV